MVCLLKGALLASWTQLVFRGTPTTFFVASGDLMMGWWIDFLGDVDIWNWVVTKAWNREEAEWRENGWYLGRGIGDIGVIICYCYSRIMKRHLLQNLVLGVMGWPVVLYPASSRLHYVQWWPIRWDVLVWNSGLGFTVGVRSSKPLSRRYCRCCFWSEGLTPFWPF